MTARAFEAAPQPVNSGQTRAHTRDPAAWSLEPHCCRVCFGRVASTRTEGGDRIYQCTSCGLSEHGHKPSVICACGLKLRKYKGDGRSSAVLVDAGVRCHENHRRTPEFPALYVASYAGAQSDT